MKHDVNGGNKGNNNRNLPAQFNSLILGAAGRQVTTTHLVNICIAEEDLEAFGEVDVYFKIFENKTLLPVSMVVRTMALGGDEVTNSSSRRIHDHDYFELANEEGKYCVDFEINTTFFVKTNATYTFVFEAIDAHPDAHQHEDGQEHDTRNRADVPRQCRDLDPNTLEYFNCVKQSGGHHANHIVIEKISIVF